MGDSKEMLLTGGIMFGLLTQAKYSAGTTEYVNPNYESVTDPILMAELIRVVTDTRPDPKSGGFSKDVSKYRNCQFRGGKNIPFTDEAFRVTFNQKMFSDYKNILNNMTRFTSLCLNPLEGAKHEFLIKQFLRLIELDNTIADHEYFYVCEDGSRLSKKDLLVKTDFNFQAFLLGVFHYIVNHGPDNTDGEETYKLLFPATDSYLEGCFNGDVLGDLNYKLNLTYNIEETSLPKEKPSSTEKNEELEFVKEELSHISYAAKRRLSINLSDLPEDNDCIKNYLNKAIEYNSSIKTLLYSEKPRLFNEFYVCNDLYRKANGIGTRTETITDATTEKLRQISLYCIISGTGGIGKSMMMRHLFFQSASRYDETSILPILVSLKDYNPEATSLVDFLLESIREYDERITLNELRQLLANKKCILLLDGLDEIPIAQRDGFELALKKFIKQYGDNQIILSSRPFNSFIQYSHFTVVEIQAFTKEQSLRLIDKLDFHDPIAKGKFKDDLERNLYRTHQQFASNPLLLTIMLMTYTTYGDIPAKRHVFYSKAYETMSRLHDASKGAYVRPMQTNLSPEDFAEFFAEFCARTYKEELLEFTEQSFKTHMDKSIAHQRIPTNAKSSDFLIDITQNLCLMYKEGEKYYFFHRSFQEYFSAVFFSKCMDDKLWKIGEFFEEQKTRQRGDLTFDMLYDMIPEEINRYIILPFLRKLYNHYDEENGYWTFLEEMFPILSAAEGEANEYYDNEPESFLFSFIVEKTANSVNASLYNLDWPDDIHYFGEKTWCEVIEDDFGDYYNPPSSYSSIVEYDDLPYRYRYDDFYDPEIVGYSWEIEISEILEHKENYAELISFMEKDDFPLKKLYNRIRKDMDILDKHFNQKKSSEDWFDDF